MEFSSRRDAPAAGLQFLDVLHILAQVPESLVLIVKLSEYHHHLLHGPRELWAVRSVFQLLVLGGICMLQTLGDIYLRQDRLELGTTNFHSKHLGRVPQVIRQIVIDLCSVIVDGYVRECSDKEGVATVA